MAGATPCSAATPAPAGRRAGGGARRRGAVQPRAGRARRARDPRPQAGPARGRRRRDCDFDADRRHDPRRRHGRGRAGGAIRRATVFRVEPNTPVELRCGVVAIAASDAPEADAVKALFARVGTVVELPERLIGVAGAISGVGPAYWALLAEAWTDAALRHGIPASQAATLVRETMAGTAATARPDRHARRPARGRVTGRLDRARPRCARARRRARGAGGGDGRRGGRLMEAREQIAGFLDALIQRLHADHLRLDHRVLDLLLRRARARTRAR